MNHTHQLALVFLQLLPQGAWIAAYFWHTVLLMQVLHRDPHGIHHAPLQRHHLRDDALELHLGQVLLLGEKQEAKRSLVDSPTCQCTRIRGSPSGRRRSPHTAQQNIHNSRHRLGYKQEEGGHTSKESILLASNCCLPHPANLFHPVVPLVAGRSMINIPVHFRAVHCRRETGHKQPSKHDK